MSFRKKQSGEEHLTVQQIWDRQRAQAQTSAELAEIDAVFARYA